MMWRAVAALVVCVVCVAVWALLSAADDVRMARGEDHEYD